MPDYKNTKIYYIEVNGERYYGHTTKPLHVRRYGHVADLKRGVKSKVYEFMRSLDMNPQDIELVLVEDFPCKNRTEAETRERYWIEGYGNLNETIPTQTMAEWTDKHKDRLRILRQQRYKTNADLYKGKAKEYVENNKDKVKQRRHAFYIANKERLKLAVKTCREQRAKQNSKESNIDNVSIQS